jgi:hypothetical protein
LISSYGGRRSRKRKAAPVIAVCDSCLLNPGTCADSVLGAEILRELGKVRALLGGE